MFTIGIDLGTTNSVACVVRNGVYEVLPIDSGKTTLPSVVAFTDDDVICGREALYLTTFDKAVFSIKRDMGSSKKFFGRSAAEISSEILKKIKFAAENYIGDKITSAVITVPAHFSDSQRIATTQAASLAGIKVLRLINEPTSAAIAFGLDSKKDGVYAVYDLGGGTFDFSVLRLSDGIFQVLATGGDTVLGGDDIDHEILQYNLRTQDVSKFSSVDMTRLRYVCKRLKESFCGERISENISVLGSNIHIEVDLDILKNAAEQIILKTFQISEQVIADAMNIDLDGIVLIGGGTKLPFLKKMIVEKFSIDIYNNINPDEAVAIGAAIHADSLSNKNKGMLLIDVVPLSIGLETFGGGVDKIIYRNTPVPIHERREYTTYQDNQTGINFHVVQGERPLVQHCKSLAKFELTGFPMMRAGSVRVVVDFEVDVNSILSVRAYEKTTKLEQCIIVEPSEGLNFDAMAEILKSAMANKQDDENAAKLITITIESERMIKFWREIISELDSEIGKIVCEKIEKLEQAIVFKDLNTIISIKMDIDKIVDQFVDVIISNRLKGKAVHDI